MYYEFKLGIPTFAWTIVIVISITLIIISLIIILPVALFKIRLNNEEIYAGAPLAPSIRVRKGDVVSISFINLSRYPELKPTLRLLGIGLPGLKIGWFKLANGSKAFLALNGWDSKALVIKLRSNSLVILSPKNFNDFKSKLQLLGWVKPSS